MDKLDKNMLMTIDSFLTAKESSKLSQANKYIHKSYKYDIKKKWEREKATVVIKRFLTKYLLSPFLIRKYFVKRCIEDKKYRKKSLCIHEDPIPHLCIRSKYFWNIYPNILCHIRLNYPEQHDYSVNEWIEWFS